MELPTKLSDKASEFHETSYGATKVTLVLNDNKEIKDVILAWGTEIVIIGNKPIKEIQNLNFKSEDIVDVLQA